MKLRERVNLLEGWQERQRAIESLRERVIQLEKELGAVEAYLGVTVETYKVRVVKKEEGERE